MTLPSISQTVSGSGTSVSSYALGTWTPSANDLIVVWVAIRQNTPTVTGVAGNGITFANVFAVNDQQGQVRLECWRGQAASPSSGQITVTLSGSVIASIAAAHRIAGANTGGTNGSAAVEVSASADTGGTDTTAPSVNITTLSNDTLVIGGATHRNRTYTVGAGETAISINNTIGAGGDTTSISMEYQNVTSPTAVTINGTLDSALDWIQGAVAIKPAGNTISFAATCASTSATPNTPALPVARGMIAAAASLSSTPDTSALLIARSLSQALAATSSTPDVVSLLRALIASLSVASGSSTPNTPTLISLVSFALARSSASSTPDTVALPIARALALALASQSSTPDLLRPRAHHIFSVPVEDWSSAAKRTMIFTVPAEDWSSAARRTMTFTVSAESRTSEA